MRTFLVRSLSVLLLAGLLPSVVQAQMREVTGVVVNEFGQPLETAIITEVSTGAQAVSDREGRFTITVPTGEVELRFENFGYRTTTITVSGTANDVRVTLNQDALNLEGIVVTGQATSVARRNLANAVATVTSDQIEGAPTAASVENYLQGKVPGAYIESNSGAPGGGIQVRLRGPSTINGELEPLYVVDGIVMSNASIPNALNNVSLSGGGSNGSNQDDAVNRIVDLNPQDIERIEILKGASAAALYGSRAANGVVLITTKRGQPGQRRINFTQRFGTFDLLNEFEFRDWNRQDALDAGLVDETNVDQYFSSDGPALNPQNFEQQLAGENPFSWETLGSVSGGNQDTRYFLSAGWKDDGGIIENTGFERQSLRVTVDQAFSDRISAGLSANLVHSKAARGLTNNDNSGTSYYMVLPFTPGFIDLQQQSDGTFPTNPYERSNPFQTVDLFQNEEDVWRFLASATFDIDLYRGNGSSLVLNGTGGADFFQQANTIFAPPELQFEPNDGLAGTSQLSNSSNTVYSLGGNLIFNMDRDGFDATTTLGTQFQERELDISRTLAQGLTAGQQNVNSGVQTTVTQNRQLVRDLGFFAQQEVLLLDERLLVTAGIRADRSSVNGDPDKYYWFPKAAASYRFDNLTDALTGLKFRVAYGQSGNQPLYGQKFTPLTATTNIGGIPGVVVQGTTGDVGLKPERQIEFETGVDVNLFDGRTSLEFTYFNKDIQDLILQRTPAPSTGFNLQVFNGGAATVQGFEAALAATPIRSQGFQWISTTTFSRDWSEVTDLPVPAFETGGFGTGLGAFRIEEGQSLTQIVSTVGPDENGDPIVQKVGDANPTFRMGFSNDFVFGSFRIGTLLDWSEGNDIINLTRLLADAGANTAD
ncbi:MAG: SusC/RagA family TonB-linked outer membrane protein, partial [Gemmatimonadota bacterium]